MKERIILIVLMVWSFGIGYMNGDNRTINYYYNGVIEGRCIERDGTIHNVDESLKCVINNNLE